MKIPRFILVLSEKNRAVSGETKAKVEEFEKTGNTTMLVQQDEKLIGIITLMDTAREDAKETLAQLNNLGS